MSKNWNSFCCLESLQCSVSPPSKHFLEYGGMVHMESTTLPVQKENIFILYCKSATAISNTGKEERYQRKCWTGSANMRVTILGITN